MIKLPRFKKRKSAKAIGNIERRDGATVSGWMITYPAGQPLSILADGKRVGEVIPDQRRPDVQAVHGGSPDVGFSVDLQNHDIPSGSRITLVHEPSGFHFNRFSMQYDSEIYQHIRKIKDLFDVHWYRARHDLHELNEAAAFEHFISHGIHNDFDPCRWFDHAWYRQRHGKTLAPGELPLIAYLKSEHRLDQRPSENFDPRYYAHRNPDLEPEHGYLNHYVTWGRKEGRWPTNRSLPKNLLDDFAELSKIEPQLSTAEQKLNAIVRYPFPMPAKYLTTLTEHLHDGVKAVIVVPFLSHGGADLIATFYLKAMQEHYSMDEVLLIVTESSSVSMAEWLKSGTRVICMEEVVPFNDFAEKVSALHVLIGHIAPEKIININSHACWEMYRWHAKPLATVTDLYASLFCFDYSPLGAPVGYIPDYLPETLPYLRHVWFDNQKIIDDIRTMYGFPEALMARLHCVYTPLSHPARKKVSGVRGDKVLWCGRLSRQKRPDILVEVAERLPQLRFDVYGPEGNDNVGTRIMHGEFPNIEYRGVYNSIEEIDFSEYRLFLCTSEWEGLPTVLIQMMSRGLPVLSSRVGGIDELVNDDTGWLVDDFEDIDAYERGIRLLMDRGTDITSRTDAGKALVRDRHSWAWFVNRLAECGAFDGTADRENTGNRQPPEPRAVAN
ncbi:MAG: hypothetical protein CSB44_04575 [Gammaproteobacteria bacterium]|nr:MAG: hypothetical protein CSB44_04575 [Gammaproteobacteria bacterium]